MPSDRNRLYRRHRFPPEVIGYAVWLYFRFALSLRMVEEMLAARGIRVTYETVRTLADLRRRSCRISSPTDVTVPSYAIWLELNAATKPFDNVDVRRALNYAIPQDEIIRTIYYGYADKQTASMPYSTSFLRCDTRPRVRQVFAGAYALCCP
jgi:ABC-type transport system substrate-binding protein